MSATTLYALVITLCKLYQGCSITNTGYTDPDCNLNCVVDGIVVAGSSGGVCHFQQ